VYFQVLDVGPIQGIGWAAAGLATGPIMFYALGPYKRRRGIDNQVDLETGELYDAWARTEGGSS
jgi:hypothetical protein